jgi:hypothetical protein
MKGRRPKPTPSVLRMSLGYFNTAGIYRTGRDNSRMDRRLERRVARTVARRLPVLLERRPRGTLCSCVCIRTAPSGTLTRNRRAPT